jgi:glycosyltransferase involved in cell wall biosynthesis
MRLLILSIEYPPLGGGASPVIHELNKQFLAQGHQVTVVTMALKGLKDHEIIDGVDIFRVRSFRTHKHISNAWEHSAFLFSAKRLLRDLLKQEQFDFCYTHFILPTGILSAWLYRRYNIPFVITAHGSDIPGFNPDRFRLMHLFTPPIIRRIIRQSKAIITPSMYLRQLILDIGQIAEEKIITIPNGVDTNFYAPDQKKPVLVSTGRLLDRKGFQYLLEAVADEQLPIDVHICGDGPMMPVLKSIAAKSKTQVHFHGWLNNKSDTYRQLMAEATYFSLVSAKENASISLLEALASGCVVITSNTSGCPESVGEAGICIPPADPLALKAVLKQFIDNPELRDNHMQLGRTRAVTQFSWPAIADRYLALMKTVHETT